MALREERHWWYTGMRRVALALLAHNLDGQRQLRILDAGCGTGGTTVELRRFGDVVGIDVAWEALEPARGRGLEQLAQASIEQLPFRDAAFVVGTSLGAVCHLVGAQVGAALRQARCLPK